MNEEHLTLEELITSINYCLGNLGGSSCNGCPNLVPGSIREYGLGVCRCNTTEETLRVLEAVRDGRTVE